MWLKHLLGKHEALNSNPSLTKKKKKKTTTTTNACEGCFADFRTKSVASEPR
jgi:hypothetical protein